MESILNAVQKQNIPIEPTIVISNKPSANGLKIARKLGVQTEIVESKGFQGTRWEYDQKIIHVLSKYDITPKNSLICLAGFMRILSSEFIKKFKNQILNIHPSILPAFPGLDAQRQAIEAGASHSGCTVHFVNAKLDSGKIILQKKLKIKKNDTPAKLENRIHKLEYLIYPAAIKRIVSL